MCVIVLINERCITRFIGTEDPYVMRNLRTKFDLNGLNGLRAIYCKWVMALTQIDGDFFIYKIMLKLCLPCGCGLKLN